MVMKEPNNILYLYSGINILNEAPDDKYIEELHKKLVNTYKSNTDHVISDKYADGECFKAIKYLVSARATEVTDKNKDSRLERVVILLKPTDRRSISGIEVGALRFIKEMREERDIRSYIVIITDFQNTAGYRHVDLNYLKKGYKVQLVR